MASHGITRTTRNRTEEQRQADLDKIAKYTTLESSLRVLVAVRTYDAEAFALTTKLLRLNPEYYTIWNVRRRCLTCGLLSRRSPGSSPSVPPKNSSATSTPSARPGDLSISSSRETPPGQEFPEQAESGRSGTTADEAAAVGEEEEGEKNTENIPSNTLAEASEENQKQDLEVLESELAFTIPLLLAAPKCYWIWNYRLWLLEQAISRLEVAVARKVWEQELGLDSKMLTKDKRNFHAWGYRRQLVAKLESPALHGASMVEQEFEYTTKMIHVDLSNFSAWYNRSQLIPRLLDERGSGDVERQKFLDDELSLVREALNVGPEDQSLWNYHQYLILNLTDYVGRATITPNFSPEERKTYVMREMVDIKDLLEDYHDVKWIYEALMEYTLALCAMEERDPDDGERQDLKEWLAKLRSLDPMRNGRWNDLGRANGLI